MALRKNSEANTTDRIACCVNQSYASEIQETANGCRGGARRQTRRGEKIFSQGRVKGNGQIDEHKGTQGNGRHEAQGVADEKSQKEVEVPHVHDRALRNRTCRSTPSVSNRAASRHDGVVA